MKIPSLNLLPQIHVYFEDAIRHLSGGVAVISDHIYDSIGRVSRDFIALDIKFIDTMGFLIGVDEKLLARLLSTLIPEPHRVRVERDPDFGSILVVEVDANARRALNLWLNLAKMLRGVHVVVEWTGETDVSEDELADYLVRIAVAGGYMPIALPGFNAVETVREGRDRWHT
jgi:hypothetical protein